MGDEVAVPARFAVRRTPRGYEVLTNTRARGELAGKPFTAEPNESWQPLGQKP